MTKAQRTPNARSPSARAPRFSGTFEVGDYIEFKNAKFQVLRKNKYHDKSKTSWEMENIPLLICRPVARWPATVEEEFTATLKPIPTRDEWIIWADDAKFLMKSLASLQPVHPLLNEPENKNL